MRGDGMEYGGGPEDAFIGISDAEIDRITALQRSDEFRELMLELEQHAQKIVDTLAERVGVDVRACGIAASLVVWGHNIGTIGIFPGGLDVPHIVGSLQEAAAHIVRTHEDEMRRRAESN